MTEPASETPIIPLPRLSAKLDVEILIKRDDLAPIPGGGSKWRKVRSIMQGQPSAAVVTSGHVNSNHCRTVALFAASSGIPCDLVLYGDTDASHVYPNFRIAELAGATIHVAHPTEMTAQIESIKAGRERAAGGRAALVIPGGGHCKAGAVALRDAALATVASQLDSAQLPDLVIHASGTGTTQAGLAVGFAEYGIPVVGVSVARSADVGRRAVEQAVGWLTASHLDVRFVDEYVGGGYGLATQSAEEAIRILAETEGIPLDPVYTGKAMAALIDFVRVGSIEPGTRVLFWHTGGLMNLISSFSLGRLPGAVN